MTHILFAGHHYYPAGGMHDLHMRGTVDELKAYFVACKGDVANGSYIDNWGQIVRADTLDIELRCGSWNGAGDPVWELDA